MPVPVISIAEMREWEKATWASGQTESEVIRHVGKAVAARALQMTRFDDPLLILCGKGHNGDDARWARELLADRRVELLDVKDPAADLDRLEALLAAPPALIIDGLFGVGLSRPLDAAWVKFIECVNATGLPVLAVDVPSGLNADNGEAMGAAVRATVTLTVGAPKRGMLRPSAWPFVGRLDVAAQVGLGPCPIKGETQWTLPGDFRGFPPPRPVAGHKGTFGHLAIIAGSVGYHGAAVLAARAAQRARAGLITVFPHESAYGPVAAQLQAAMVRSWEPGIDLNEGFDAVLMGPGLASPQVPAPMNHFAASLWKNFPGPVVADATALAWLPPAGGPADAVRLITPHPGEAGRLLGKSTDQVQADRPRALRELSRRFGHCWVVLKGNETLVGRSDGPIFVNCSGNPGLAQGGSGDVLGGYLAGLLAQPLIRADAGRAIRFGVWQHGATADRLAVAQPNWVTEELAAGLGLDG
jgi:ADP-dependent NAD(P)H-hydrate dehydratase / NAD(P)H-hydrate epimerase